MFTVSHYGEQAVSFKMVDLPKSLHLVFARRSSTDSGKHLVLAHSSSTDSGCLFPAAGTLTRATAGSDQFSVWNVKEMYRVKVVSAKNTNVAENHKVTAQDSSVQFDHLVSRAELTVQLSSSPGVCEGCHLPWQ